MEYNINTNERLEEWRANLEKELGMNNFEGMIFIRLICKGKEEASYQMNLDSKTYQCTFKWKILLPQKPYVMTAIQIHADADIALSKCKQEMCYLIATDIANNKISLESLLIWQNKKLENLIWEWIIAHFEEWMERSKSLILSCPTIPNNFILVTNKGNEIRFYSNKQNIKMLMKDKGIINNLTNIIIGMEIFTSGIALVDLAKFYECSLKEILGEMRREEIKKKKEGDEGLNEFNKWLKEVQDVWTEALKEEAENVVPLVTYIIYLLTGEKVEEEKIRVNFQDINIPTESLELSGKSAIEHRGKLGIVINNFNDSEFEKIIHGTKIVLSRLEDKSKVVTIDNKDNIHNLYHTFQRVEIPNEEFKAPKPQTPFYLFKRLCLKLPFCTNPEMASKLLDILYRSTKLDRKSFYPTAKKNIPMFYAFHIRRTLMEFLYCSGHAIKNIFKEECFPQNKIIQCFLTFKDSQILLFPTEDHKNLPDKIASNKITRDDNKKITSMQLILVIINDTLEMFFAQIRDIKIIIHHSNYSYKISIDAPLLSELEKETLFNSSQEGVNVRIYSINTLNTIKKEFTALERFCRSCEQKYYINNKIREIILQPYFSEVVKDWCITEIAQTGKKIPPRMFMDYEERIPNRLQLEVAYIAAKRRLALIQGPPGTGKTYVAALIVKIWLNHRKAKLIKKGYSVNALLKENGKRGRNCAKSNIGKEGKILVTAYSNSAVEELYKKLQDLGINVAVVKKPQDYEEFKQYNMSLPPAKYLQYITAVKSDLSSADVICVTCVKSMTTILEEFSFTQVIIDEATYCTEIGSLCGVVKGCEQLILIGDEKQLPPMVFSKEGAWWGMGISMYERIQNILGLQPLVLQEQYRMHPSICEFPSQAFYSGRLQSDESTMANMQPSGFPWPNHNYNVCFINVPNGVEERAFGETSFFNKEEIALIATTSYILLRSTEDLYLTGDQIGIIAGYQAQRLFIREALIKIDELLNAHSRFSIKGKGKGKSGKLTFASYSKIEVNTIDGFQGREKKIIILGTSRSNKSGKIGFLKDERRLNVSLTRAQDGLVIFGNMRTLNKPNNGPWPSYLQWLEKNKLIMDIPLEWYSMEIYQLVQDLFFEKLTATSNIDT